MVKGKSFISTSLRNLAFALVLILTASAFAPTLTVQAAEKKKTTITDIKDSPYKSEINKVCKYGGLKGLISKKKFHPGNVIKKNEFAMILSNLYGDNIKIRGKWLATSKLTQKGATDMLDDVSKQLGHRVTWSGGAKTAKVTREKACNYIILMIKCQPELNPTKIQPKQTAKADPAPGGTTACLRPDEPVPPIPPVKTTDCPPPVTFCPEPIRPVAG